MASTHVRKSILAAATLLAAPGIASADFYANPYVAAQETWDSNVFSLSKALAREFRGDAHRADSIFEALAGVDAAYRFGLQRLFASAEGRRYNYKRFDELDHDESTIKAGLSWNAQSLLDGTAEVRQERRMASFINRRATDLTVERERVADGNINLNITPQWRLETGATYYELNSPLSSDDPAEPDFPDFTLRESTFNAGVKYLTTAKISVGLAGSYGEGRFSGIPDAPGFHTTTASLTTGYKASEISDYQAVIGYTRLVGDTLTVAGFSGDISYTRDITALTAFKVQAFRRMNGYLAGADVVIDVGAGGEIAWQPTLKIRVEGGYTFTRSKFQRLSEFSNEPGGRVDTIHLTQGAISYQMLEWVGLQIFGGYRDRNSNVPAERFNGIYLGAQVRLSYPIGVRGDEEKEPQPVFNPDMPST